jgi:Bacterial PH domain/Short C-terminal domain
VSVSKLDKLLGKAQEHLEEGEEVVAAVQGSYETKILGEDSVRTGIFAATNRRLVFYAKKMTGYDLEVFPYENISSIEMGKSMMGHHIKLFASGNEVRMKWIKDKDGVARFVNTVKDRMKGGAQPDSTRTAPAPDLADQIRRLGELRAEGLLSEEEFQAQKQKLLSA